MSKRELYGFVGDKQQMLATSIAARGDRMRLPEGFPEPTDRASLETALRRFGETMLRELSSPGVSGDLHIAELIGRIQASAAWPSTLIIVTYDENGGSWDHVPPPFTTPRRSSSSSRADSRSRFSRGAFERRRLQ